MELGGCRKCLENGEKSGNFEIENEWQPWSLDINMCI